MAATVALIASPLVATGPNLVSTVVQEAADANPYDGRVADSQDPSVTVGSTLEEQQAAIDGSGGDGADSDTVYFRATVHQCWLRDLDYTVLADVCAEGTEIAYDGLECDEDSYELAGLWAVTNQPGGAQTPPQLIDEGACVTPADLLAAATREFKTMPIDPAEVTLQVERDWAIVNFGVHPRTDDTPQVMATNLLGVPVEIRAVPAEYTWDAGDGTDPVVTDHPGGQWDTDTAIHLPYPAPGTYTVSLTTTWHGQFRITGTPTWTDVPGEATTTDTTYPIEVHDAEVRLVQP
ncbi:MULTISPECIES: PKD domain-containing protein [Isoptericola]|nr:MULTISPECIES: PKD domain-containing protein [Isoptericola]